jgi:hypothetical protein
MVCPPPISARCGPLEHFEFLADDDLDPREEFTRSLCEVVGRRGPIVVYNATFESLVDSDGIIFPPEGCFSDLLHDKILQAIQELGYEWVWVGDEFGTERKLYWIQDLKGQDSGPTAGHCNVFTPNKALLWTTHWDSHFSFLCSSMEKLRAVQETHHFEGFYCTPRTEIY